MARPSANRVTHLGLGVAIALTLGWTVLGPIDPVAAQDGAQQAPQGAAHDAAQGATATSPGEELATRYAPIFELKEQTAECDRHGEAWAPMAVDALFDNPQIALRQVGDQNPVVKWGPSAHDLAGLGGGFYLDFPGSSLAPGCIYEQDFQRFDVNQPPTVYAHIIVQPDRPDELVLQYWSYWYFNHWNNTHESDWEMTQLVFPASSVEEALRVEPTSVGYAQHEGGERAAWSSSKLHREGDRPIVYSSVGSHASYFDSALYLGRSGSEGFGCDDTDGPSKRVDPKVVLLPDAPVTNPADPLAWTSFAGRWGERQSGPWNGPTGPYQKERWSEPLQWNDNLRSSSAVVPGGDSDAVALFHAFCDVVAFGSNQILAFKSSPTRAFVTVAVLGAVGLLLVSRTSWTPVSPLPVKRRRRAGQILRSTGHAFARAPVLFTLIGIAAVPLAALASLLSSLIRWIPVTDRLLVVSGPDGIWRIVLAAYVGGVASLLTTTIVIAAVSSAMADMSAGRAPSLRAVVASVWHRSGDLARGFVRAAAIVVALMVTIVGIPFAIWQLIRYQFLPQVVMTEGLGGRAALARSSALVRGRWWHTAIFVGVVDVLITLAGSAVGVLIVLLARPPVWLLSIAVTVASLVVMPLTSIAVTLLYGDAASARDEGDDETAAGPSQWATTPIV